MFYNLIKEIFKEVPVLDKVDIKDRIRKALEIREITQSELAERANIDKGQLSSYISGKYKPRQNNIDALATALNVNEAWLMGFDVPMERDDYEDQKVITFEAKSEAAINLLEEGGYTVSFSDNPKDDIITIINSEHEPVSCMHEYELVNKYESLQQRNMLDAESLAEIDLVALDKYKAARKEYMRLWNFQFFEKKMLESFSQLNDINKKKSISYVKNLLSTQKMEDELILNAAHERTDIEVTDEMRKHDDDIMNDENF